MKLLLSLFTVALSPLFVGAQEAPLVRSVDGLLNYVIYLASRALPLLILLAVVWLLYGIFKLFFFKTDADKGEAKSFVLWGIVALFVMTSVWGLVNLLGDTFRLNNANVPAAPSVNFQSAPFAPAVAPAAPANRTN